MNDSNYALEVLNEEEGKLIYFDRAIIDRMEEKGIIQLATSELMMDKESRLITN